MHLFGEIEILKDTNNKKTKNPYKHFNFNRLIKTNANKK